MSHDALGVLLLSVILVLCIVAAGCTGTQETLSPHSGAPGGEATTARPSTIASSPASPGVAEVAEGNNRFAFDLYSRLANDTGENVFFSPFSVSSALAIACEGARGQTADEIRSVVHLPANDTLRREGFAGLAAVIDSGDSSYTLRTANALWAEETYRFLPDYIGTAGRWYSANVTNLDFVGKSDESRVTINQWVENQTERKIRDLLPPGSITSLTRLVITNAIFFKGTWAKQFDPALTADMDFRTAAGSTVKVPMMQRTDDDAVYRYGETSTYQVLEMPYEHGSGTALSMIVILPRDNDLSALETALDAEMFSTLRGSLVSRRVDVYLPKFGLETAYRLPEILSAMGMPTAFGDAADLSGMDGTTDLYVDDVVHKAFVEVNEEGTEAAAATAVVVNQKSAPPEERVPVFRADHPFVFVVHENGTGAILFMGRVANPAGA